MYKNITSNFTATFLGHFEDTRVAV